MKYLLYHSLLDQYDEEAEESANQARKIAQLDALEAGWRAEQEAQREASHYASSYSSWLSYGTSFITNIIENIQVSFIPVLSIMRYIISIRKNRDYIEKYGSTFWILLILWFATLGIAAEDPWRPPTVWGWKLFARPCVCLWSYRRLPSPAEHWWALDSSVGLAGDWWQEDVFSSWLAVNKCEEPKDWIIYMQITLSIHYGTTSLTELHF